MNKIPPFIPNSSDDVHCVQAVYRMILKYYLNRNFSWKQIDALAHADTGKGTWTFPLDTALVNFGIQVTNIENTDYGRLYKEGEQYLRKVNGEQSANYYIEHSNIASILRYIPEFITLVPHETRKATVAEIISKLKEGKLIAAEINASILNRSKGHALHCILIYDSDGKHVTFHDPGLPPHSKRRLTIKEFSRCFAYNGAGQAIDVFSK